MGGFKNSKFNNIVRDNLFRLIFDTLVKCSELMYQEYLNGNKTIPNHEEKIRSILLDKYLDNDSIRDELNLGRTYLRFIPEVPENFNEEDGTYKGRLDIKVISENTLKSRNDYYTIECKRLDGKNDLNKKYVDNGIKRFISEPVLYPSYNKKNIMFGFIVQAIDINKNADKINIIQRNSFSGSIKSYLKILIKERLYCKYSSEYYLGSSELELAHLFFDFSKIIK